MVVMATVGVACMAPCLGGHGRWWKADAVGDVSPVVRRAETWARSNSGRPQGQTAGIRIIRGIRSNSSCQQGALGLVKVKSAGLEQGVYQKSSLISQTTPTAAA